MKTKVKVIIELEIEHYGIRKKELKRITNDHVRHLETIGASLAIGSYRVVETSRIIDVQ